MIIVSIYNTKGIKVVWCLKDIYETSYRIQLKFQHYYYDLHVYLKNKRICDGYGHLGLIPQGYI